MEDVGGLVIGQAAQYGLVVALLLAAVFGLSATAVFCFRGWRQSEAARIKDKDDVERSLASITDTLRAMDAHLRSQRQPNDVLRDMLDLIERRDRARGP